MSQMPEPYLVAAVKRGDLKAYEQLFMHYYPIVRAFVLGFVKIDVIFKVALKILNAFISIH